jgi:hypothetical protein
MRHSFDAKEEQLKAAETKTKKLLKISAKIRLDAARAKAAAAGDEEQVSEVDTQSGDEDDMFEMMAAYYNDEDYMDMQTIASTSFTNLLSIQKVRTNTAFEPKLDYSQKTVQIQINTKPPCFVFKFK